MYKVFFLLFFLISSFSLSPAQGTDSIKNLPMQGLAFRSIGPAITGGRVIDIAVNPSNHSEYYIASGHGSLWKTTTRGITFFPVFDGNASYAIGAVEIDPFNHNIVWVGTGENKNQNNVIYGDGIYKSEDGGQSWNNMGLKTSEHIGGIAIDPFNSDIVYVAAMGSLRNAGGERGIFKTTDGGSTWENVLKISEYTGCYEVHINPGHSNIIYATAHQRMRNLYTGVHGGPESGIYRSTDYGNNWVKLKSGLPSGDIGRIGMSVSPVNNNIIYAIIDAEKEKGVYKSIDRGASWKKQSSYVSSYPFYFQKLYCDTKDENRVYSDDVFIQVTNDGGKTWNNLGDNLKHVDNHALWINPDDNNHIIAGCDGGVYETFDRGAAWGFKANLPIAEIYKVTTDNSLPFYNVYIGTQDNNSLGGPSRTISSAGILNQDWLFTNAGDGFETQVDWENPDIIYAQSQNGGLVRFDKKSGENLFIRAFDFADTAYRFDWDAALLLSSHDSRRLYSGSHKLLRSDDRGSTWREVSYDLTRGVPVEMQKLMGQSWSIDQMTRKSTMAQISTIAESRLDENILFTGSGDGLIHATTDGGITWIRSSVPGLPDYSRIHHIIASNFDKSTAYAACQNMTGGDYHPYIYKTTDTGKSWFKINGNIPERGSTYSIAEDHVEKNLLFLGTQFGVYYTIDGGKEWIRLTAGIPNASVMDLEIQRRENDLVVSTFGRGVYILDDYTPLRYLSAELLKKDAEIFPVKDALMFVESNPFGFKGKGFQGANFYSAPNPEPGAVFTYYLKEGFKTLKEKRRDEEKEKLKAGEDITYPPYDVLKKESEEAEAFLLFTITDESGDVVRHIKTGASKGINRIVWNFRYNSFNPVSMDAYDASIPWNEPDKGYMVVPGKYFVSLSGFYNGKFTQLVPPVSFICKPLNNTSLPAEDPAALNEFNKKTALLIRAVSGADSYTKELFNKISYLKKASVESPGVALEVSENILAIELALKDFNRRLNGDQLRSAYEGSAPTSIRGRVDLISGALWNTTGAPTTTFINSYEAAASHFEELLSVLKKIDEEIKQVEYTLERAGAQYTPGRFPEWKK